MKKINNKETSLILVEELVKDGIYRSETDDLIQVREVNVELNRLYIYNITESCSMVIDLNRHRLIKRVR